MATRTKKLFLKLISSASHDLRISPLFFYLIQILSALQTFSVVLEPLFFITTTASDSTLKIANELSYYVRIIRILGQFPSESTFLAFVTLILIYELSLGGLLGYCAVRKSPRKFSEITTIAFLIHSRVLFYPIHYFLINGIDNCMKCGSDMKYCDAYWRVYLIILVVFNFAMALFKEVFLYKPQKTRDISNTNNPLYCLISLLQKTLIICLLYFLDQPKYITTVLNILASLACLYVVQETMPFYNLNMLRINVLFSAMSVSFSLILIPEVCGSTNYTLWIAFVVTPLLAKASILRGNILLKRVFLMKKDTRCPPKLAIHLPLVITGYMKRLKMFPSCRSFNKSTLFLSGFVRDDMEDFMKLEGAESLKQMNTKLYVEIVNYLNDLRVRYPTNELLLLTIARIYAKKLKDLPRTILLANEMKSMNLSLPFENAIDGIAGIIQKAALEDKKERQLYESYFEYKHKAKILKREIQKEISEHIVFWKLNSEKRVNVYAVSTKAQEISRISRKIKTYWQVHFQGHETANFELAINYGHYLHIVQGLPFEGLNLIKNTSKAVAYQKMHTKIEDADVLNKKLAMIIVSIEPDKQGKILNTCNLANSFFEVGKGSLAGVNINGIIPKAFGAKHNETISQLYAGFKFGLLSQHPISYVRTLKGKYFKASISLQVCSSMDQGLSFVISIKRLSENESLILVDSQNKILEFSADLGKTLHLNKKGDSIENVCPEIGTLYAISPRANEGGWNTLTTKFNSQEKFITQTPLLTNPASPRDNLLLSNRGRDDTARLLSSARTEPEEKLVTKEFACSAAGEGDGSPLARRISRNRVLRFSILNHGFEERKKEYRTESEDVEVFGEYYRIFKLKEVFVKQRKSVQMEQLLDEFADNFPEEFEKEPEVKARETMKTQGTIFVDPFITALSTQKQVEFQSFNSGLDDDGEFENNDRVSQGQHERKSVGNSSSIASSQISTRVLAKSFSALFHKNKMNRLTQVTVKIIFLALVIVILTATIDFIATKSSLQSMENAVNLVDLINKRLYKAIYSWQTVLKIMTSAFGFENGTKSLQAYVKTSATDSMENNILLQEEVMNTNDEEVIQSLYKKSITLWDPQDQTSSVYDSFRANDILVDDYMFIANYHQQIRSLRNEPSALSAANNTANSYLLAVQDSIVDVTEYFMRTKEGNVTNLILMVCFKNFAIFVAFIFVCIMFRNIVAAYKRLFKFASKVPQATLHARIAQLEGLKPYFDADSTLVYEGTEKKSLSHASFKLKIADTNQSQKRTRDCSFRDLVLNMVKYQLISLVLILPAIAVFFCSFVKFKDSFDNLQKINGKMLISYDLGTEIGMISPSFYFYQNFRNSTSYRIRDSTPLDQFYTSLDQLNEANKILLAAILTNKVDDAYVHAMFTGNICDYVTADTNNSCASVTKGDDQVGLLNVNTLYHQVATKVMTALLNRTRNTLSLDSYSLTLKDVYQTLADHFLELFKSAVDENMMENSSYFALNIGVIVVTTILIRVFVFTKFQDIDIGVRKILRLIPYQMIEDNKMFMNYLKREFQQELKGITRFNIHELQ